MEAAALRGIEGARDLAAQDDLWLARRRDAPGNALLKQDLGVGMQRTERRARRSVAVSTSLPRYMTPIRVLTYFTTARSCAMNR